MNVTRSTYWAIRELLPPVKDFERLKEFYYGLLTIINVTNRDFHHDMTLNINIPSMRNISLGGESKLSIF